MNELEGISAHRKSQENEDYTKKFDFYKNFKSIKIRCKNPDCGKIIEETNLVSHGDNWNNDLALYKNINKDGSIEISNSFVSSCSNCEYEQTYSFGLLINKQHKPTLTHASKELEFLNYSNGIYQLIYKCENFKSDNFLEQLKGNDLIIFNDVDNYFNFEKPTLKKGFFNSDRTWYEDKEGYADTIPENTIILENGVTIYNNQNATKKENMFISENGNYEDNHMIYPINKKGIKFNRNVLIIPQNLLDSNIPSSIEINSDRKSSIKEEVIEFN